MKVDGIVTDLEQDLEIVRNHRVIAQGQRNQEKNVEGLEVEIKNEASVVEVEIEKNEKKWKGDLNLKYLGFSTRGCCDLRF